MEIVVDKFKGFAKSTQEFATGVLHWPDKFHRRKPIEILKRLQREAFSDLMKLRDRQDKVERLLSFYKSSKGNPFDEASTRLRGDVDIMGLLLMIGSLGEHNEDAIHRAGIRTSINSRFTFETTVQQRNKLAVEFVASDEGRAHGFAGPLSLAKVLCLSNVNDWLSVVGIPVGAKCRDLGFITNSYQDNALSEYSSIEPPLLNQYNGSAIGLSVKKSNLVASLAQSVSVLGRQIDSAGIAHCLSTFGQITCQLSRNTKLLLLGLHQLPKSANLWFNLGSTAVPIGTLGRHRVPETSVEDSAQPAGIYRVENVSSRSMALMLESQLDESTRVGGWLEMNISDVNASSLKWAVSMSDTPDDDFGWGLSLGGLVQDQKSLEHFQAEAFLKFNLDKRFSFQPAAMYVIDGTAQFPALALRCKWSF